LAQLIIINTLEMGCSSGDGSDDGNIEVNSDQTDQTGHDVQIDPYDQNDQTDHADDLAVELAVQIVDSCE
jgi:hypothetical protein